MRVVESWKERDPLTGAVIWHECVEMDEADLERLLLACRQTPLPPLTSFTISTDPPETEVN